MNMDFKIDGAVATVRIGGEIDHHTAKKAIRFSDEIIDLHLPERLILDFSALKFMDSSGLALILGNHKKMRSLGGDFRVVNVPAQPMKVLTAVGMQRIVDIAARKENANEAG